MVFQFLGRNSGRSDHKEYTVHRHGDGSFNSSVGILVVRTIKGVIMGIRPRGVSIPRSEFWSFGLTNRHRRPQAPVKFQFLGRNSGRSDLFKNGISIISRESFNSSVGILVVRTMPCRPAVERLVRGFNSSVGILVVRTPVDSSLIGRLLIVFQFLGRNSGRSDHTFDCAMVLFQQSFNSSVGILVVRTVGITSG